MLTVTIAGVTGVLSGALGIVTQYLRMRPLVAITNGRHAALAGTWRGRVEQPDQPAGYVSAEVVMHLRTRGRRVVGEAEVCSEPPGLKPVRLKVKIVGGEVREGIIRLDYANALDAVLQFGTFYLRLDADGDNLDGRFAGYGNKANGITYGRFIAHCDVHASS